MSMSKFEGEDELLEELDVFFCNKDDFGAQLYVLQYPLRPKNRPYKTENVTQIQFKPESKRLEMDLPTDLATEDITEFPERGHLQLKSSEADLKTTFYTVGYKRKNAFYLTQIEGVLRMEPSLDHLDPEESEPQPEKPKEMTQLQVKVRKRETAIEQHRRENSYAHLAKKEKLERWRQLQPIGSSSRIAGKVLDQLMAPVDKVVDMSMSKTDFLSIVAPEIGTDTPPHLDKAVASKLDQKIGESEPKASLSSVKDRIGEKDFLKELWEELSGAFASDGVLNLKDIRQLLRVSENEDLRDLAVQEDDVLHKSVLDSGQTKYMRRVYIRESVGSVETDSLREILLELLETKDNVKRNDVVSAGRARGLRVTEKLFDAVMREICVSKEGGFWQMKTGRP